MSDDLNTKPTEEEAVLDQADSEPEDVEDDADFDDQVEEDADEATETTGGFDQETYVAVTGLIQRLSIQLDELKEKQKEYKERLKNLMENDSQLAAFEEQSKEATLALKNRKKEILGLAEAIEAKAKMKEVSEEMKDIQESLTNNLLSYYQMTGVQTFDLPEGGEREFKLNAKLMPKKE